MKRNTLHIFFVIAAVAAVSVYAATYSSPPGQTAEDRQPDGNARVNGVSDKKPKIYNYTPGERPDYGLPGGTFKNLPPISQDFWEIDEKFYRGGITDFVDMDEKYWKQPEFYPTFEDNIEFIKNPQGGAIYAFGTGAYPGDIGAEAPPNSTFTVATFFYSSWVVETYQGILLEVVFPPTADILTPDLQRVDFTVRQDPSEAGRYFDVAFDPELFVLGPSAPVFDSDWARKVRINVTVKPETPKGSYVIGVSPAVPPEEYSEVWKSSYEKYADTSGFRIGRPSFQLVVFVV